MIMLIVKVFHGNDLFVLINEDHMDISGFDIRITPTVDLIAFEKQIREWCESAGEDVTYRFLQVSQTMK